MFLHFLYTLNLLGTSRATLAHRVVVVVRCGVIRVAVLRLRCEAKKATK